jgi:hypothetical protein
MTELCAMTNEQLIADAKKAKAEFTPAYSESTSRDDTMVFTHDQLNHMNQIGDWIRIDGKLYQVIQPITETTFTIKRLYWFHLLWIRIIHPYYEFRCKLRNLLGKP